MKRQPHSKASALVLGVIRANEMPPAVAVLYAQRCYENGNITRDEMLDILEEPIADWMINAPGGAS